MISETIALLPSILHVTKTRSSNISEKQFRSGLHLKAFARDETQDMRGFCRMPVQLHLAAMFCIPLLPGIWHYGN